MTLKIIHKNNTSAGQAPAPSDLDIGEIAVNSADAELFTKDTDGAVQKFISKFKQSGSGAVARTVESKFQDVVSVKDFGAVGDGVTDDKTAIQAAITYANTLSPKASVFFPPGKYFQSGTGSQQAYQVPAGVKLFANNDATILAEGYPYFYLNSDCEVRGLIFDGETLGGVNIGIVVGSVTTTQTNIVIRDCAFIGGSQLIYLYKADKVRIQSNSFKRAGYQIIQRSGYASNNVVVTGNVSDSCTKDFVELNSGNTTPTKNWTITSNVVTNLFDPSQSTTTQTEARFFGSTSCDGVIIANNIVDTIGGDSAIHCEKITKNLSISNNVFINCHSTFGKIAFFPTGSSIESFVFSDNIVKFTSDFVNWTGEGDKLIRSDSSDSARIFISGNSFVNESVESMSVGRISTSEDVQVTGNRFNGFDSALITGAGDGASVSSQRSLYFTNNIVESCAIGLNIEQISTDREYRVYIDDNTFVDVDDVYISAGTALPFSLTNNVCRGTTNIDEAKIIGTSVETIKVFGNFTESGATTTRDRFQLYTDVNVAKTIFSLPYASSFDNYGSYELVIKTGAGSSLSSNNATLKVIRLDNISPIKTSLTTLSTENSGIGADFTLALNGSDIEFTATSAMAVKIAYKNNRYPNHTPDDIASV